MCYGCFCTQATKNNACKKSESQKKHVTKKCVLQKNVCKENTIIKWPQNKKSLRLFVEPKSMGKKLIIEPTKPRVYWVFSDSNNSVLGIFLLFFGD